MSPNRGTAVLGRAGTLLEAGNFNQAADYLAGVERKTLRAWRALLNALLAAHRFEELARTYEAMPAEPRKDFDCRHLYLLAAANLKRSEAVGHIIGSVLEEPDSEEAAAFLAKVYLFAEGRGPTIGQAVVKRILDHGPSLAASHFDIILKCAHHLRSGGMVPEAQALEAVLRREARSDRNKTKIDILDAQLHFWGGRYDLQLDGINAVLARQGLDPIALKDAHAPLSCDNLRAASEPAAPARGPLVSILMPAYNSAETLSYALQSLRSQTYRDFEVIVVDDSSDDETALIATRFCDADPRFRLITLERNSGAFVARNAALAAATGEFVTNQDADDWAHPQKIATAVAELQRNRSAVATWVEHIRCSRGRGFRALNGYLRPDASSLMYRRDAVMARIGWYDSVRAAGDGEFHLRMERAFGRRSIVRIDKLLSFVNWSEGTLSGGGVFAIDSELGLFSPARSAYRRSFGLWHETTKSLHMPFPLETRPFPVPDNLLPARPVRA
ncbi:glycosyltransferase family 2 protein [Microvirga terrae]|uniref:Glycosyltransferase family 2 protein n=1 Tax=Microvirga terrae TaxID=2740529 RepID=A0ABY5RPU4_9HYPH|nr:glycosyltransferase family A protein [Microvirga terrae]UVF18351.1 glycosyltransferase family 2 protein [Microvirga terrae]